MVLALQAIHWLDAPMRWITDLGSMKVSMVLIAVVYWCVHPRQGLRVGLLLLAGSALCWTLKLGYAGPRPFWYSSLVEVKSVEFSFGLPSGHAMNSVIIWGFLAMMAGRWWAWGLAVGLMFLVGLSRIYLGVHFPSDVLLGWLLGAVMLWLAHRWAGSIEPWALRLSLPHKWLLAWGTALLLLLPSLILAGPIRAELPLDWVTTALKSAPGRMMDPFSLKSSVDAAGGCLGLMLGGFWLAAGPGWRLLTGARQQFLGCALGFAGAGLLVLAGKLLIPLDDSAFNLALRFARYALVGVWLTALAPFCFQRLGLTPSSPSARP